MMIRLPDLNAVFVCPQKVASTSIKRAVLRSFDIPIKDGKKWEKANSIALSDIGDEDIFSFVRNPFDRIVSCYHNQCLSENRYGLGKKCHFVDFVTYIIRQDKHTADKHFKPLNITVPQHVTFIGRFECLQRDWSTIRAQLPMLAPLTHENKTGNRKHWSSYYDSRTMRSVYDYYKGDFERFGY